MFRLPGHTGAPQVQSDKLSFAYATTCAQNHGHSHGAAKLLSGGFVAVKIFDALHM